MFRTDDAWWCNGTEIAHADGPGEVDIRLTKKEITKMRERLANDPRVALRRNASDWISVRYAPIDVPFIVELVERAAVAHRPPENQQPRQPPTGTDLEKRRRLH